MSEESKNKPPYLPYTTFKNVIANLNANGKLVPARIDKTVLAGQSGGMQSYIWSALRFFALIDEGKVPTEDLKELARADGDTRKAVWRRIFDRAYAPVIGDLDMPSATLGMLQDKFSAQDLNGETVRKCHSFYVSAADDAGLELPSQWKTSGRGSVGGPRRPRKPRSRGDGGGNNNGGVSLTTPPPRPPASKTMREMLLEKFPAFNPEWSAEIQAKWFEGFEKLMKSTGDE